MGLAEKGVAFIDHLSREAGYRNEWIVIQEAETDPQYGYLPWARPIDRHIMNGVINLDKPPGPTSHEVVAWIKRIFGVNKAGHGGTLDPKVTGVLPVGLGNATKVIGTIIHTVKEYIMVVQLHGEVDLNDFKKIAEGFVGLIYQKPPLRSRVKRVIRKKRIYEIEVLEKYDKFVLMRVLCDPGTYMRKLAYDIGLLLNVGCHMRELRRVRTGPFREDYALTTMQEVSEAVYLWRNKGIEAYVRRIVLPIEYGIVHLPKIMVLDTAVNSITHGADLAAPGIARLTKDVKKGDVVALLTLKGELIALGKALRDAEEIVRMNKGIVVKNWRVIMERNIYPKCWGKKG